MTRPSAESPASRLLPQKSTWLRLPCKAVNAAVVLGGLALAGAALHGIEPGRPPVARAGLGERPYTLGDNALGLGAWLGWLGGFRTIAADFAWLEAEGCWEERDAPRTVALLKLTTALDPRPLYFWVNGARILACDVSAWRIDAAGGYAGTTRLQQHQIDEEQARMALGWLASARRFYPTHAELWIEQGAIELNRQHDLAAAAESYRHASEQADAPFYAARLHAELLRRLGRPADAYAWLKTIHPSLPRNDEAAAADLVLARICELERELAIPAAERYAK